MSKMTDDQLVQGIELGEQRVRSLQRAIVAGYAKLWANELAYLKYQIEREQKQVKHYKTMLRNRVRST